MRSASLAAGSGSHYKFHIILIFRKGVFVLSRSRLKRALLFSLTIFGSALLFQIAWAHSLRVAEVLYILETGSAASALAIGIVLIATI